MLLQNFKVPPRERSRKLFLAAVCSTANCHVVDAVINGNNIILQPWRLPGVRGQN